MKSYSNFNILAFTLGVISSLFVSTPAGFVAMLDMVSYIVGPLMFVTNYSRYTQKFRRLLSLLFLWIINAVVSDIWRGTPFAVAFKAEMILVNSFTLVVIGEWLMRKTPYALPLFLSGNAISAVISLYYFQNGALLWFAVQSGYWGQAGGIAGYLIEKQVKPLYAACFFMTAVMCISYFKMIPWFLAVMLTSGIGFYLLFNGGARSIFLIYQGTAVLMFLYVYKSKMLKMMFSHKVRTCLVLVIAAISVNALYTVAAKSGWLGEEGVKHYEDKVEGRITFLDDRADLLINWPFLWRSPIIGAGSEYRDKWGYVNDSEFVQHYNVMGHYINYEKFFGHSCIVGAWTSNGIFGLITWAYVLWLIFDFLKRNVTVFGSLGPFVIFALVNLVWDILFSPYGGFRGKAMFCAAFLTLSQDRKYMEWLDRAFKCRGPVVPNNTIQAL